MATSTRRDVKLVVTTETEGAGKLQGLADELRNIGKSAGAGGPELERLAAELDRVAAATKARREAEAAARADSTAARTALNEQRDALARLRAESTATTRATEEHQQRERALRVAIIEARAAVRDKAAALQTASAETRAAVAAEKALQDQARATAAAFKAGSSEMAKGGDAVAASLRTIQGQLAAVRSVAALALGGTLTGGLLRSVSDTADAVTNLQARIKLVTGEGAAFGEAWQGVQEIAQRTNSTLEGTGTLFARIAAAGREMGVSQRDALALTETINQAIQVSGASAQASDAALTQLIQGLQSGVLRGEEFNSVMEQAPRLARALADGLGVTTGELRAMAQAGQLSTQAVIGALRGQAEAVRAEYSTLPPTVGRAIQQLTTAWQMYVNEANAATGASATAAGAISALARNLDSVAAVLVGAGKAAAAYAALNLAQSFLASAAAAAASTKAKAAETAATVASTTATAANTAARVANTAATVAGGEAATVAAGRFAGFLSTIKTFSVVAILANVKDLGTAIGETAARWMGWGKAIEENERRMRADEEATRRNADAKAALAQRTALAADKALGLSVEAKALVGVFDQSRAKAESTSEALAKLTKALQLGDIRGIRDAGAALDALAQKGKIAADQIADAMAAALRTEDLARFEAQARVAFDSSTQGARRLQAALDAIAVESLRRAGTSLEELRSGFSAASTSALNDLDALKRSLDDLGARGDVAGRALATSIGKALDAATTTTAVQAVIDRIEELGEAGTLTGDALAEAMGKARGKLDDLREGVNSTAEAFRVLGLKSGEEMARVAAASKAAWDQIRNDGTVALAQKQEAFKRYASTVTALAGTEAAALLKVQAEALGLAVTFDDSGKAIVRAMGEAGEAIEGFRGKLGRLREDAASTARSLSSVYDAETKANADRVTANRLQGATYDKDGWATDGKGNRITAGSYLPPPDDSGAWEWVAKPNQGYPFGGYWQRTEAAGPGQLSGTSTYDGRQPMRGIATPGAAATPAPAPAPAPRAYNVTINLNGRRTTIGTASAADQTALVDMLRELETASDRG